MKQQGITTTADVKKSPRILTFDIMRGLFLAVILINHIELYPSFFDFFTGRGRLLVSAAEGFFFMSGLLVGMVYKRRLHLGFKFIFGKMWKRALELYAGSVFLTLLFTALATYLHHPTIKDSIGDTSNWPHILEQTMLMRYGYGWADFLDRFAILMMIAPFGFYLLAKRKWWLFSILSLAAWAIRGDNFTLSWQIIFGGGMLAGFYWNELRAKAAAMKPRTFRRLRLSLFSFTGITFTLSYLSVYLLSKLNQNLNGDPWRMPHWLQSLTINWNSINDHVWLYSQKWTMGPVRIVLFAAWFLSLYLIIRRYEHRINHATHNLIEILGRNSLFVYISHAFIVFAFRFFIPPNTSIFENFFITASALALLLLTAVYYQRLRDYKASTDKRLDLKTVRRILSPTV